MASIVLSTGPKKGLRLPLRGDSIGLGRDARCDIIINESMLPAKSAGQSDSVSRRHAIISRAGGDYYIEDGDGQGNPSRNKTFVNDARIPFPGRQRLRNGDRIRICD